VFQYHVALLIGCCSGNGKMAQKGQLEQESGWPAAGQQLYPENRVAAGEDQVKTISKMEFGQNSDGGSSTSGRKAFSCRAVIPLGVYTIYGTLHFTVPQQAFLIRACHAERLIRAAVLLQRPAYSVEFDAANNRYISELSPQATILDENFTVLFRPDFDHLDLQVAIVRLFVGA
jgi:hypothetical protein